MNRYSNIKQSKLSNNDIRNRGINYYSKNTIYPEIPFRSDDIYVSTDMGDNLPDLAYKFYNDVSLYWIISAANPDDVSFGSIFIPLGTQLRIPVNISSIIDEFNKINSL